MIEADEPPTAIFNVPVPTTVAPDGRGCEARLAAVARFCTCSEYCAGMAAEVAVAEAILSSPSVTVRPASVFGSVNVVSVACRVSSALLKVP